MGSRSPGRGARGSSTRPLRHYNPLILAFPELVEIDKTEVSDETKEMDNHKEVDTTKALYTITTEIRDPSLSCVAADHLAYGGSLRGGGGRLRHRLLLSPH